MITGVLAFDIKQESQILLSNDEYGDMRKSYVLP